MENDDLMLHEYAIAQRIGRGTILSRATLFIALATWGLFGLAFPLFNEVIGFSALLIGAVGLVVGVVALSAERTLMAGISLGLLCALASLIGYLKYGR